MRNVFLALLLINVLAWVGFAWYVPEREPLASYAGPGITLVREVEAAAGAGPALGQARAPEVGVPEVDTPEVDAPEVDAPEVDAGEVDAGEVQVPEVDLEEIEPPDIDAPDVETTDAGLPAGDARCVAVGPFAEPEDAERAAAVLAARGLDPREQIREQEIWEGYWVFIEGIESTPAANAILEDLAENGVSDAYVISRSERGVLISLGVYSGITRAGARAEQVAGLDYEATIAERARQGEVRWLEVALPASESIDLDALRRPGAISRLEVTGCR